MKGVGEVAAQVAAVQVGEDEALGVGHRGGPTRPVDVVRAVVVERDGNDGGRDGIRVPIIWEKRSVGGGAQQAEAVARGEMGGGRGSRRRRRRASWAAQWGREWPAWGGG